MKTFLYSLLLTLSLLPSQCMSIFNPYPKPGATEQQVIARMGQPAHRYLDGEHFLLEFPGGQFGHETFMARMGQDGKLVTFEQVRTPEKFGSIRINQSSKEDVLKTVGTPSEVSRVALQPYEIWSYRYKENHIWYMMMHVYFDESGIVRKIESGRDPLYEG